MKSYFIINPTAGRHNDFKKIADDIAGVYAGEDFEIYTTRYAGDATEYVSQIGEKGETARIFAVGGDGTLNEVIRGGYRYPNLSFGIIPTGTGNDFIRSYPISRENFLDFNLQKSGHISEFDLGLINSRPVINSCSMGFDADVVSHYKMFKGFGALAYNIAVFYTLFKRIGNQLKVEIDDNQIIEGEFLFTLLCNGKYYGGGFMPAPNADVSDGLFDFVLIKKVPRLKIVGLLGKYKKGQHTHLDICKIIRGKKAKITASKEINVQFDGELLKTNELNFELHTNKIKFILPQQHE